MTSSDHFPWRRRPGRAGRVAVSYVESEVRIPAKTDGFVPCPVLGAGGQFLILQVPVGLGLPWIRKGTVVELRRSDRRGLHLASVHLRSVRPVPLFALRVDARDLPALISHPEVGRTALVTGGKGGTGKTFVATALALMLAEQGHRTLLVDADLGAPNVALQLGVAATPNLGDVLFGRMRPDQAVTGVRPGLSLLAGARGAVWGEASAWKLGTLTAAIAQLRRSYEAIVIDSGPGMGPAPSSLLLAADWAAFVTSDEPASLSVAFTLLDSALANRFFRGKPALLLNRVRDLKGAERLQPWRARAARRHRIDVPLVGTVHDDPRVVAASSEGAVFSERHPAAPATAVLRSVARQLFG